MKAAKKNPGFAELLNHPFYQETMNNLSEVMGLPVGKYVQLTIDRARKDNPDRSDREAAKLEKKNFDNIAMKFAKGELDEEPQHLYNSLQKAGDRMGKAMERLMDYKDQTDEDEDVFYDEYSSDNAPQSYFHQPQEPVNFPTPIGGGNISDFEGVNSFPLDNRNQRNQPENYQSNVNTPPFVSLFNRMTPEQAEYFEKYYKGTANDSFPIQSNVEFNNGYPSIQSTLSHRVMGELPVNFNMGNHNLEPVSLKDSKAASSSQNQPEIQSYPKKKINETDKSIAESFHSIQKKTDQFVTDFLMKNYGINLDDYKKKWNEFKDTIIKAEKRKDDKIKLDDYKNRLNKFKDTIVKAEKRKVNIKNFYSKKQMPSYKWKKVKHPSGQDNIYATTTISGIKVRRELRKERNVTLRINNGDERAKDTGAKLYKNSKPNDKYNCYGIALRRVLGGPFWIETNSAKKILDNEFTIVDTIDYKTYKDEDNKAARIKFNKKVQSGYLIGYFTKDGIVHLGTVLENNNGVLKVHGKMSAHSEYTHDAHKYIFDNPNIKRIVIYRHKYLPPEQFVKSITNRKVEQR